MDVTRPLTAISPGVHGQVLLTLASSTRPHTGREVARLASRSKTGVQRVLDRLVEHGLVDRQEAGEAFLYTLNRDHVLAPVVEQMVAAREELFDRLHEAIAKWEPAPFHASVFGSAARGDGGVDSDIDLFIVRRTDVDDEDGVWRRQVHDLAASVRRWTGNHAGIAEVSEDEIPRLRRERPPVIDEVGVDAVDLAGPPARKLLSRP